MLRTLHEQDLHDALDEVDVAVDAGTDAVVEALPFFEFPLADSVSELLARAQVISRVTRGDELGRLQSIINTKR